MRSNFATMTDGEVSSFVTKFGDLLNAGLRASLVMECDNGHTRINLEVFLQTDRHQPNRSRAGHHHPQHPVYRPRHPPQHPAGRPPHPPQQPAGGAGHPLQHPDGRAGPSRLRRREHREMTRRSVHAGQAATSAAQAGPEHPPQAEPNRVPVSPPHNVISPHNVNEDLAAVQTSHLPPEHVSPLPLLPPYLLHIGSPPPRQQYGADFSSFCFLSSHPSEHPLTSSSRRIPSPRPDPRDKLCEIRKPVKYLKVLLSQNIQRAVENSGGGCGGWVREVSVFRLSKFVDYEMLESLIGPGSVPNPTSLTALGPFLPQGKKGVPLPHHVIPLPLPHQADGQFAVPLAASLGAPGPTLPSLGQGGGHHAGPLPVFGWSPGELPVQEQIENMSYEELIRFAEGGDWKQKSYD